MLIADAPTMVLIGTAFPIHSIVTFDRGIAQFDISWFVCCKRDVYVESPTIRASDDSHSFGD